MEKELLIATHNLHKKEEFQQMLPDFRVLSLTDFEIFEEIIENGATFAENAQIKADFCFEKLQKPSLGDDSGLVIEALGGQPGIFSARYAGTHHFNDNVEKVLTQMKGVKNRNAYFITVLCWRNADEIRFFEGRVYGEIAERRLGEQGFGYDPIFIPRGYEKSFAEISGEQKNAISHRRKALSPLLDFLQR